MTSRPYRIWREKAGVPYRYYTHALRAHEGVLKLLYPSKTIGVTLEVINIESGRLLASYTRQVDGIAFRGAKHGQRRTGTTKQVNEKVVGSKEKGSRDFAPYDEIVHAYSNK